MPSNIKILPGGRSFPSEGNSTLLEAGLHSGLALGYGCSNGNCGECLARIVSGEVRKVRHHDYVISEQDKNRGYVLMCCHTAVTDVVLEAPEAQSSAEIPQQKLIARVRSIEQVNNDVALLHLKTPRSQRLRFLAGQYVRLGGNGLPTAAHAISSCPCDDMNLHFQIPRSTNDVLSGHVFNDLKKGDKIMIVGPEGDFVLNESSDRPLVFIAWHTGFAPIRSLVEHAMALEKPEPMKLVWITRSKQDRYLDNLCRSWQDAFDNFAYQPLDIDLDEGVIDTASIFELADIKQEDISSHDFYVAGNEALVNAFGNTPEWSFMVVPPLLDQEGK
jgi:CDP-4-dehydro-6-deoxyglucose reductase